MKNYIIIASILLSTVWPKAYTVSDPPMVYIYHFVSYDSTSFLLHGGVNDETQNKLLKLPLLNNKNSDISSGENLILGKPLLDPKLVSAMVTSAVAKNPHIQIAGESIQSRIIADDFIKLVKSYNYPERTDYIFIGEINTVASQYEVDIKLIDVSTQSIVNAHTFNLPFESLNTLRDIIEDNVTILMRWVVYPFTGEVYIRVDSTSIDKVRWDDISIRPLKVTVGNKLVSTTEGDYVSYLTGPLADDYRDTHNEIYSQYDVINNLRQVSHVNQLAGSQFLAGDYRFRGFLKNNEKPVVIDFNVKPGDLNEIHISLPYVPPPVKPPPPPPPPPELGTLIITNIWDGLAFEVFKENKGKGLFSSKSTTYDLFGSVINKSGKITSRGPSGSTHHNSENKTATFVDIPLGNYVVNAYAITDEQFPGKHFVEFFSETDTLTLNTRGQVLTKKLPARIAWLVSREIIIYFDPFPPGKDDEYRLYIGNSNAPFTVTRIAGEVHLLGLDPAFNDTLRVDREGFQPTYIPIEGGQSKSYHIANLSVPKEKEKEKKSGGLFGRSKE
jgi:hypothetical protein